MAIADAAARSSVLIAAVWALLKSWRSGASDEKVVWTWVAAASLGMPLLAWSIDVAAMSLQVVPQGMTSSIVHRLDLPPAVSSLGFAIFAIYCLGLAGFAARLGAGLWLGSRLCRRAQRGVRRADGLDVRLSSEVRGPVTFGSTVLLPAGSVHWDDAVLRAVLAHEREHIRNRDAYRLWLALLCRAGFWFNPLVHWLYHRLVMLTELTSDAAAAAAIGDRASYVKILLQLTSDTPSVPVVLPMASAATLPRRIRHLVATREPSLQLSRPRRRLLSAGVLLMGALIAACASRPPLVMARITYAPTLKDYYPQDSRRNHEQGYGVARLCIAKSGRVISSGVQSSTGHPSLDTAMLRLVQAFRFAPATRGGRPVAVCTTMPAKFSLSASG